MSYLVLSCFNLTHFCWLHILHVPPRKLPHRRQESSWGTYCGLDPSGKPQPCSTPHWGSKRCVCLGLASPLCTTWVMARDFIIDCKKLSHLQHIQHHTYNIITFSLIVEGIFWSILINLWAIKNHRYIVHKDQRWCSHGEGQEHWLLPGRSLLCQLDGGPGRWTHRPHHGLGRVRNVRNVRIVFEKVELWWAMFYLFIDVDRLHTHNTHTLCVCVFVFHCFLCF